MLRTISTIVSVFLFCAVAVADTSWDCVNNKLAGSNPHGEWKAVKCTATLTSDGSGDSAGSQSLTGWIARVVVNPDGTSPPTTGYDVYLNDADGIDLLGGSGVGLTIAAGGADSDSAEIVTDVPRWVDGAVDCVGDDMGASKIATVVVYLVR